MRNLRCIITYCRRVRRSRWLTVQTVHPRVLVNNFRLPKMHVCCMVCILPINLTLLPLIYRLMHHISRWINDASSHPHLITIISYINYITLICAYTNKALLPLWRDIIFSWSAMSAHAHAYHRSLANISCCIASVYLFIESSYHQYVESFVMMDSHVFREQIVMYYWGRLVSIIQSRIRCK